MSYFVAQIIKDADGEVVYESKPTSERLAERIADGMSINLNWDEFTVQVIAHG